MQTKGPEIIPFDHIEIKENSYIIKCSAPRPEGIENEIEKITLLKESKEEYLVFQQKSDNFNVSLFAKKIGGLSSIEICCIPEISWVLTQELEKLTSQVSKPSLDMIYKTCLEHFINCTVQRVETY